jgi:hypothetical protein
MDDEIAGLTDILQDTCNEFHRLRAIEHAIDVEARPGSSSVSLGLARAPGGLRQPSSDREIAREMRFPRGQGAYENFREIGSRGARQYEKVDEFKNFLRGLSLRRKRVRVGVPTKSWKMLKTTRLL